MVVITSYYGLFVLCRLIESHWFTWSTQISHLSMAVDLDKRKDWASIQLAGTCDASSNWFSDWFLGHLNYQIEHQLVYSVTISGVIPHYNIII